MKYEGRRGERWGLASRSCSHSRDGKIASLSTQLYVINPAVRVNSGSGRRRVEGREGEEKAKNEINYALKCCFRSSLRVNNHFSDFR